MQDDHTRVEIVACKRRELTHGQFRLLAHCQLSQWEIGLRKNAFRLQSRDYATMATRKSK